MGTHEGMNPERNIEVLVQVNNIQESKPERFWTLTTLPEVVLISEMTDKEIDQILEALRWAYLDIKGRFLAVRRKHRKEISKEIEEITEVKEEKVTEAKESKGKVAE